MHEDMQTFFSSNFLERFIITTGFERKITYRLPLVSAAQKYQLTRDQITFALPTADVREGNSCSSHVHLTCLCTLYRLTQQLGTNVKASLQVL